MYTPSMMTVVPPGASSGSSRTHSVESDRKSPCHPSKNTQCSQITQSEQRSESKRMREEAKVVRQDMLTQCNLRGSFDLGNISPVLTTMSITKWSAPSLLTATSTCTRIQTCAIILSNCTIHGPIHTL